MAFDQDALSPNRQFATSRSDERNGTGRTSLPAITLPKGGGALRGIDEKFTANPISGTGSLTLPLTTSPGRAGFGPLLMLKYDSGAGNGPFGFGWQLVLPAITRKTDKGLPLYRDAKESDVFLLSGAEDLVPVLNSNGTRFEDTTSFPDYKIHRYAPRIEGGFARIERWTRLADGDVHWRSYSSENILTIYGKDDNSRIVDPGDPYRIFSWLICETRDDRGQAILYEYKAEDATDVDLTPVEERNRGAGNSSLRQANRYIKSVKYGNRTSLLDNNGQRPHLLPMETLQQMAWMFEVVFDYGEHQADDPRPGDIGAWFCRHDPFSSYRAGFEVRTYRLCQRILMFHHFPNEAGVGQDCLVHSTDLVYRNTRNNPSDLKRGNPLASFLASLTQTGYQRKQGGGYTRQSLPPLECTYSQAAISSIVQAVDMESVQNLPDGLDGVIYQWVDLNGEGLSGMLTQQSGSWFYKPNLGDGKLGAMQTVVSQPSLANLRNPHHQLLDLDGDGQLDLVQLDQQFAGFYERTPDESWEHFVPFTALPNVNWDDPNLRLLDLTGNGFADLLFAEEGLLTWYPSLAEDGFGSGEPVFQAADEERGPRLLFADGTQTIFLADFSGDRLVDLVRIRNGEVCYWPNLGYGRFGAKVTMSNAPWFDAPEQFDPRRIRLADIDGTGASDILYLGAGFIDCWFNQAGNSWSEPQRLPDFPHIEDFSAVQVADLLGNGTACIVWSSPLPADSEQPMKYIDLMGGQKPHLLTGVTNNFGAETLIHYAPSTKFYLADKQAGLPWVTKLPFPVHVVESIEARDHVSGQRLVSRYTYHHGYFDGVEREFRGFAMVEQQDTEAFADYVVGVQQFGGLQTLEPELYQPPVTTRTWFHTGAFLTYGSLIQQLRGEYYLQQQTIPEPLFPAGLDEEEYRECVRALKGLPLRQEVYSFDGTAQAVHPYSVLENNYTITLVQPRRQQRHAIFLPYKCETITHHFERNPVDPRVSQSFTLEVDRYGNALKSASVVYGRKISDPALPAEVTHAQQQLLISYSEIDYTPDIDQQQPVPAYRLRLPHETRSYDITGIAPASALFALQEIKGQMTTASEISYEVLASGNTPQKRRAAREQALFRANALNPLPPGQWDTLGLSYQSYQLAFTLGVTNSYYTNSGQIADADFSAAGYVHFNGDSNWWIPSATVRYPADPAAHFYLPVASQDPLGLETVVTYDQYELLAQQIQVTQAPWNITTATNDYRVLGPVLVTNPNQNRSAVEINELGLVVKSAVMGKQGAGEGDTLADPTVRLEYNLWNWMGSGKPNSVHAFAREQYGASNPRFQESYLYINGYGGVAMSKVQAHPGKALQANPDGTTSEVDANPRWIGNGRTILNNKGNPVKQYEPFFSTTFEYEDEKALREIGSTVISLYDALGRQVRTLFPNGTFARNEFDAWMQRIFDVNDTMKESQWYADRGSPDPGTQPEPLLDPEQRAAWLAAKHANTPTSIYFDSLGRSTYTVVDYGGGKTAAVRVKQDMTGRYSSQFDQQQREIASGFTGMVGTPIYTKSAEHGQRWTFQNVLGLMVKSWDDHGRVQRAEYDALHRPVSAFVREADQAELLFNYLVYGDRYPNAVQHNLLGVVHQTFDQAGVVQVPEVDFTGNPIRVERILAKDYAHDLNWNMLATQPDYTSIQTAANPLLELSEVFLHSTSYDALNRPTRLTLADGTIVLPTYNEANMLATLSVQVAGQGAPITCLQDQDYDAKGQRQYAHYGNDVWTRYAYDAKTYRLTTLQTYPNGSNPETQGLQYLRYTYDPKGNVTQIRDDAQQTYYFNNSVVKAEMRYEYDAVYQLIKAGGREHASLTNNAIRSNGDLPFVPQLPHANDLTAVRTYTEFYEYDLLGNLSKLQHTTSDNNGNWTQHFHYAYEDDPGNLTNQLRSSSNPGDPDGGPYTASYSYDAYSNMTAMPNLASLIWNFLDQLRQVDLGGGGTAYYVYDAAGQRVRKVIERQGGQRVERIYLGPVEIYRERQGTNPPALERRTVHISDNVGRILQIDTKTRDDANSDPANPLGTPLLRYQYSNHLGSAILETNAAGQAISYEEYHPYGTSAYRSSKSGVDLSLKRYRFGGKERDNETGLYYCGERYYAAWLGRWISSDPAGYIDGLNLFRYCSNNPIMLKDPSGTDTKPGPIQATPKTEYLRNPKKEEEAKAYIEAAYTALFKGEKYKGTEYEGKRLVIDELKFSTKLRRWNVEKWHLAPLAPEVIFAAAGDQTGAATGPPSTNPPPNSPDGAAGGTTTTGNPQGSGDGGSASGSPTGSPQGTPGGSATGSPQGTPGGSATGTPGGSGSGSSSGGGGGQPRERTWWDRGGKVVLIGLGLVALGLLTVATGGGALVMFSAGMAIGAGAATAIGGGVLMASSYSGHTTAEDDRRWTEAFTDAAMVASSPGSAIGGGIGYAVKGREGMRTGAMVGGLVEGVAAIGASMRAGSGLAAEPLGEVTTAEWQAMSRQQRTFYEWGQLTVKNNVWEQMGKLGIQGNPIAKGRFLFQTFGGRLGILFKAWNPFLLKATWGTGFSPALRLAIPAFKFAGIEAVRSVGLYEMQEQH